MLRLNSFNNFIFAVFVSAVFLLPIHFLSAQTMPSASAGTVVNLRVVNSDSSTTPPMIILNGSNLFELMVGDTFIDPGVTATDTEGDNLSSLVVITGGMANGPTVDTSVVGTTTLVYTVTDPTNGLSSSVSRTVAVNPITIPNPGPGPVFPSSGGTAGSYVRLYIVNFRADISTSSVTMQWASNLSSLSTLAWGIDPDATAGSISEISPNIQHSLVLNSLEPGTTYYVIVHISAAPGLTTYFLYSFTTMPLTGYVLPPNVTSLSTHETALGNPLVDWVNPAVSTSTDIDEIRVTRGTRYFPRDPDEGYIVYEGNGNEFIDTTAATGTVYYYTVFTKDHAGNYSPGVAVNYIPVSNDTVPTVVLSPVASTSVPLFGGVTKIISSTTLSEIFFIQNEKNISSENGIITIENVVPLTIDISPNNFPKYTEEAYIEILETRFLFKKLSSGWWQAVIPAAFVYQHWSPFTIHFLTIGLDSTLSGTLQVNDLPVLTKQVINTQASTTPSTLLGASHCGHFSFFWPIWIWIELLMWSVF